MLAAAAMVGKVMVVDDNKTVLKAVTTTLEAAGFEVSTRDVAVGTTVAIMREHPDVALVDVSMPLLEGHELVKSIRKREALRSTIVLLYSAKPAAELQQLTRLCGADGYIPKSAPAEDLVAEVTRWIEKRDKRLDARAART